MTLYDFVIFVVAMSVSEICTAMVVMVIVIAVWLVLVKWVGLEGGH